MVWNVWNHISPFQYIFPMKKHGLIKEWRNSACKINYKQVCRRKKRALFKLGASEVIANLYCNCVHLHWEGCVICSLYLRQHMKRSIWSGSIFSWGGGGGNAPALVTFYVCIRIRFLLASRDRDPKLNPDPQACPDVCSYLDQKLVVTNDDMVPNLIILRRASRQFVSGGG